MSLMYTGRESLGLHPSEERMISLAYFSSLRFAHLAYRLPHMAQDGSLRFGPFGKVGWHTTYEVFEV